MSTEREQAIPDDDGFVLERPRLSEAKSLRASDPGLADAVDTVVGAIKQDMLPADVQEEIFRGMNAAVQRSLVAEVAGLDSSVLASFKQQLGLVDSILRRTFNSDGTLASGQEDLGIEPKDVLNLSLKVTQMMVRELPKVYSMDRVQKMEGALLKVMSEHLTREQQEAFLEALDAKKDSV